MLSKTTERSLAAHAHDEAAFKAPADKFAGFEAYDAMCVQCHGAPGVKPSWLGKGVYPPPPDLAETASHRAPEQVRLAIRRGIKFTAMPALEPTHGSSEVDELTGFVLALRSISPESYAQLRRAHAAPCGESGEHPHHEH